MESKTLNGKNWLESKNIDIYYEQKKIISNLNLNLKLGENTAIIGPNGSGKTTLLKIISKFPQL